MNEKEFNTDDFGEDTLSGLLGKRRKNRRIIDPEENGDFEDDDEAEAGAKLSDSPSMDENGTNDRKRMRITMLGISGSGKTAFLSGVYQTMMMNSFYGLSLVPSANVDQAFQQIGQIADIALINRENYDFADGTLETTIFPLTLESDGNAVCDFDFTDYAGGDVLGIVNARGEMSSGARALKKQLLASDAILIFADAPLLCQGRNLADWQKATGATRINPLFNTLAGAMGNRPLTVLFVLTKIDDERISDSMKANNYARLTDRVIQAFGGIYQRVQRNIQNGWSFGVIPVSAVGEGNYKLCMTKDMTGKEIAKSVVREGCAPEPYNIETTLVYTIACILSQWKRIQDEEKADLTDRLIEEGRGNTLLGNLFSGWKKMPKPEDKVAGLLGEIEKKDRDITELRRRMNTLISRTGVRERIQRHRDHLTDDREDQQDEG